MRALVMFLAAAVVLFPLTANAIDVSGDQWGTWTRDNSPYNVVGEIRVPPDSTLVIEPGVLVNFQGHYKFIVDSLATLLAVGIETDSIFFTCDTIANPDRWHGIRFIYASSNSEISYCQLEYGKATGDWPDNCGGAIYCDNSSPMINNNTITANWARHDGAGIWCGFDSNPTIQNNLICGNVAAGGGGGITFTDYSHPSIVDNVISNNSADWGGAGILCGHTDSAIISGNVISGNVVHVDCGGGILGWTASLTISGNVISSNSARTNGGGICFYGDCNVAMSCNTIVDNSAGGSGGAAFFADSYPGATPISTVTENSPNKLDRGPKSSLDYNPSFINNTISRNTADISGGGLYLRNANTAIVNCILWEDVAPGGSEISVEGGSLAVTYSDIEGGWPGQGNINAEPLFVDPDSGDFRLQWGSPCIDAGDPNSPPDPDGTRADMGALFFPQIVFSPEEFTFNVILGGSAEKILSIQNDRSDTVFFSLSCDVDWISFLPDSGIVPPDSSIDVSVAFNGSGLPLGPNHATIFLDLLAPYQAQFDIPVTVRIFLTDYTYISLTPDSLPITIPPEGGSFSLWAQTFNATDFTYYFDIWIDADLPTRQKYGPIYKRQNFRFKPHYGVAYHLSQNVPGFAPAGEYSYYFKMGVLPDQVDFQDRFTFTKLESGLYRGPVSVTSWDLVGWGEEFIAYLGQAQGQTAFMPTDYSLSQNYPNPFNATTVIEYAVPVESDVKLQVYNIRGQKVATLVDSRQQAGYRSVSWDASKVSSGLYFYRLTAGSKVFSDRMTLLK